MSLEHLSDEDLMEYERLYQAGIKTSTRFEDRKRNGQDNKFLYHILRLLDQCQQLLETGDMDLQRAKEAMKSIRRGEWKIEDIIDWASKKEKELDLAFTNCKLPVVADEVAIKSLLVKCLEDHYGTMDNAIQQPEWAKETLTNIDNLLNEVRQKLYH